MNKILNFFSQAKKTKEIAKRCFDFCNFFIQKSVKAIKSKKTIEKMHKAIYVSIMIVMVINMSYLGIFFSFAPEIEAATGVTIFSDSFESGNFDNWNTHNNDWHVSHGSGHSGNQKASVYGQGILDDILLKNQSTSDYDSITLEYWYRANGALENHDHVYVEWYDGSTWNQLADYHNLSVGGWVQATYSLPSSANNNENFKIRFRASGLENAPGSGNKSADKDEFQLDDVVIKGDNISVCGNGIPETGEECDDGQANYDNMEPVYSFYQGDGDKTYCNTSCEIYQVLGTYCGDDAENGDEDCDDGAENGQACTPEYGDSCSYCSDSCESVVLQGPYCGDGIQNGDEACDGDDPVVCTDSNGYSGLSSCSQCNWSDCESTEYCGDEIINGSEDCDDGTQGSATCTQTCETIEQNGYCGDGNVNQVWEQCDGSGDCTEMCLLETQTECNDIILARVNLTDVQNTANGNMTYDSYVGSVDNQLSNGTWFALYENGAYLNDPDIMTYADVPGLAIQRLNGELRVVLYGYQGLLDLELIEGNIEFYNATITGQYEDELNPLESSLLEIYNDEISYSGNISTFDLNANFYTDGYYIQYAQEAVCLPYCGDSIINGDEDCDDGEQGSATCSVNCETIEPIVYCGDGVQNQPWEQCDGSEDCTEMCLLEQQQACNDIVLARVNIDNFFNIGNGNASSDIYLGSSVNVLPNGTWFPLYQNGVFEIDPDVADSPQYEDVPGVALQRLEGRVRLILHGSLNKEDREHIDGNIEFYNATVLGYESDNSNAYPRNNRLEEEGNDVVSTDETHSYFDLTLNTADDGYYTDWEIIEDCEEVIEDGSITVCKYDDSQNSLSGWEMNVKSENNLVLNGGFENPLVQNGGWSLFEQGATDLVWNVSTVDGDGTPKIEIQNNVNGYLPAEGDQHAELDAEEPASIYQNIDTDAGKKYELSFSFSARPDRDINDNVLRVQFGDIDETLSLDGTELNTTDWYEYTYTITADSDLTELRFSDLGTPNSYGTLLDNVVVNEIISSDTLENGCVVFEDLAWGNYEITETLQENWTQIEPEEGFYSLELNENYPDLSVSFVNQQESEEETYDIHGIKWNDENGNGYYDNDCMFASAVVDIGIPYISPCEPLLSDWEIYLEDSEGEFIASTTTDNSDSRNRGRYQFENLPAGDYRICEVQQDGWEQTYPLQPNCHEITLPADQEYDFGNRYVGVEELCGNGVCNGEETCSSCPQDCGTCPSSGGGGGGGGGIQSFSATNPQIVMTCAGLDLVNITMTWLTNYPSTSRVVYDANSQAVLGSAPNYGYTNSTSEDSNNVTGHSVTISGLPDDTVYYFRGVSDNGSLEILTAEKELTQTLSCTAASSGTTSPITPDNLPTPGGTGNDEVIVLGETGAPSLSIIHTAGQEFANPGDKGVPFIIKVTNNGNLTAFNVIVSNTLPEGMVYSDEQGVVAAILGSFIKTATAASDAKSWNLGDIEPGETKEINYMVDISDNVNSDSLVSIASANADNYSLVSASANLEIKGVKVLAETGFDPSELTLLSLLFAGLVGSSRFLKKELV